MYVLVVLVYLYVGNKFKSMKKNIPMEFVYMYVG